MNPIIKAFAYPDSLSEKAAKKIGFEITQVVVYKENGCLFLYVDWTIIKKTLETWKTKYASLYCECYDNPNAYITLEFNNIPAPYDKSEYGLQHKMHVNVGIDFLTEKEYDKWTLAFTNIRKYGYEIVYTPKKWGVKLNSKSIYSWPSKKKSLRPLEAYLK